MRILQRIWTFLMSIQFGVVLIVFLMATMMFATQFEASTSTAAMKFYIYGSKWFDVAVFVFVVNLIVNTLRRRPYKFRHIGFITVHCGVLVIVAGGLLTRYRGVDGTMPIPEKQETSAISLPENDLVIQAGGRTERHVTRYDLKPWLTDHADAFVVPGTRYHVRVDKFFPTGVVSDTLLADPQNGAPTLRLAVALPDHDPITEWLRLGDADHGSAVHGSLRIRVADAAAAQTIRDGWAARGTAGKPSAGKLRVFWRDGGSETLDVPPGGGVVATSRRGVKIDVQRIFRNFVLTQDGATDASTELLNPAVRFHVVGSPGTEDHLAFTKFPDFRVDPPEGETWLVAGGGWEPDAAAADFERELVLVHSDPATWHAWTSWGDAADGKALETGKVAQFGPEDDRIHLKVLAQEDRGVIGRTVTKASDEVQRPVMLLRLVERGGGGLPVLAALGVGAQYRRADTTPNEVWLFHGEQFRFDTPDGPVQVSFDSRSIPLDFGIRLDDFREETYPGVSLAASYESHVTVTPASGEPFQEKIYMNHPLKYAGYVFYQASFQRTPEGEVTILSVARDPGMKLSFIGYAILVAGLFLIFFGKPYLRKLDDRMAVRAPAAATGG